LQTQNMLLSALVSDEATCRTALLAALRSLQAL
jgi:hypothetical protein